MTILVLGPNGSGKSVYAEKLMVKLSPGDLYYIATMIPYGEEGQARVEKHRKQRESMGFITIEEPFCVSKLLFTSNAAVLLEDVSNLLSNAIFDGDPNCSSEFSLCENAAALLTTFASRNRNYVPPVSSGHYRTLHPIPEHSVFADITAMCAKSRTAVLVSIDGLTPKQDYNDETIRYINTLNKLNQLLYDFADIVIIMRDGTPFVKKGNLYDLV